MRILDNAKGVAKAVHEINNLELYQRVLNLHSDIIELVEENKRLRDQNSELAKTLALKEEMVFKEPFYYREDDEIPHCPACWEAKTMPVHVVFEHDDSRQTRWDCPSCKHIYWIKKKDAPPPSGLRRSPSNRGPNSWMAH